MPDRLLIDHVRDFHLASCVTLVDEFVDERTQGAERVKLAPSGQFRFKQQGLESGTQSVLAVNFTSVIQN